MVCRKRSHCVEHCVEHRVEHRDTTLCVYKGSDDVSGIAGVVDRKWQIPRKWLVLEHSLGEGEFGRVVRASVTSAAAIPGSTFTQIHIQRCQFGRDRSTEMVAIGHRVVAVLILKKIS